MPIANFKCVREVSSEDVKFAANKLLKHEPGNKWKTKSTGEKTAFVILELDKPLQIIGIDIGNEHSAFVEVLVSKTSCRTEDFTEILITSSFMTPFESKSSTNPNRVRCFGQDMLVPSTVTHKWHLVKVICTQPFNKHVQYGLSFLKIHVAESEITNLNSIKNSYVPEILSDRANNESTEQTKAHKPKTIANFALRGESPDSESESSAALFSRWKTARRSNENQPTTAPAIRQASTTAGLIKLTQSPRPTPQVTSNGTTTRTSENSSIIRRDRNREELLFGAEEDEQNVKLQRLSKHIEIEKQRLQIQNEEISKKKLKKTDMNSKKVLEKNVKETKEKNKQINPPNHDEEPSSSRKRHSSPIENSSNNKKLKPIENLQYRPFNQLLQGVVFVISGIQNPERANLRSKALAMGAKYKADWEPSCTHLICAFKNTPKYNQVKGKGKIVTRSWVEKCFNLKKYLPWRRYALDSDEQAKAESDTEILDESLKPAIDGINDDYEEAQQIKVNRTPNSETKKLRISLENIEEKPFSIESGSDTDDYIEDIKKKNSNKDTISTKERDVYDLTTEEEDFVKDISKGMDVVPNFFQNFKFFIQNDLGNGIKDQLNKCIKHYGGLVSTSIEEADYYIAENFSANEPTFSGEVVVPQWVFECNDMEQKVPTKPYLVSRS